MYAVTGASGQLGRLVIEALLGRIEPGKIVALVRDPARVADLSARGVIVRAFDYDEAGTLAPALAGVERLLLISSSEVGKRVAQHAAVIEAAKTAGVSAIAYTSILRADSSPLGLAVEHRATEAAIRASGMPYALLRNGWYIENYTMSAAASIEHGAVIGSTGEGRISAAARRDYAEAAARVLTDAAMTSQVYELAGDESFTLADYAAALATASGRPVTYVNMSEAAYREALEGIGLPGPLAAILAESSATAAGGALFDDGHELSALIGRATTPLATVVRETLR
ncbi:SDR family oxidoreductase [Sphingomonas sp.]|uniref:SDR family oxidoreductase n=1 Tax=Sphingomonas sp. TaxID=28214 RepID=UPI000DB6BC38|nr:SDR family oxidoreductase [Sphingomonas sp.]PZU07228.1 MAG: NAD(P)-dependent oxidoreductase [Sphingomonas sp.]